MKHAKTPWTIGGVDGATIYDADGEPILHQGMGYGCYEKKRFAVNAVNCHDELVAALEECAAHIDGALGASARPGSDSADIYEQAMATLAKAKGGAA